MGLSDNAQAIIGGADILGQGIQKYSDSNRTIHPYLEAVLRGQLSADQAVALAKTGLPPPAAPAMSPGYAPPQSLGGMPPRQGAGGPPPLPGMEGAAPSMGGGLSAAPPQMAPQMQDPNRINSLGAPPPRPQGGGLGAPMDRPFNGQDVEDAKNLSPYFRQTSQQSPYDRMQLEAFRQGEMNKRNTESVGGRRENVDSTNSANRDIAGVKATETERDNREKAKLGWANWKKDYDLADKRISAILANSANTRDVKVLEANLADLRALERKVTDIFASNSFLMQDPDVRQELGETKVKIQAARQQMEDARALVLKNAPGAGDTTGKKAGTKEKARGVPAPTVDSVMSGFFGKGEGGL